MNQRNHYKVKIKHFKTIFYLFLMNNLPIPSTKKWKLARKAGVKFVVPEKEKAWFYIGKNVTFDSVYPENIEINNGTHITAGCTLLTHILDTSNPDISDIFWVEGNINIGKKVFIGTGTVITHSVSIGDGAIIGACSVVTKDIPEYEIWAGNPARFVKNRITKSKFVSQSFT